MAKESRKEMGSKLELSVVLPTFNEAHIIERTLDRVDSTVQQTGLGYEIIVVDDGSKDNTRGKVVNYSNKNGHVKIVSYYKNSGKGHAIKTGFQHASGDIVVFIDSDLDIDPKQIICYSKALKDNDIAIASKWHPQSSVKIPLVRRLLSHAFNILVRLLTGVRLRDTQTGLKAVRKKALEKVFSRLAVKRYAYDVELLAVANLYGLKVVEMPVNIQVDGLFNLKDVWRMFVDLLGIAYRLRVV